MGTYYKEINHTIYNNKVKEDMKIMLMSDIHYGHKSLNNFLYSLIKKVEEYNPDYLLLSGDSYNNNSEMKDLKLRKNLLAFYKELSTICKTFMILGNHELMGKPDMYERDEELYNNIKDIIYLLDNELYEDEFVRITGKTLPFRSYFDSEIRKQLLLLDFDKDKDIIDLNDDKFNILMAHSPQMLDDIDIRSVLKSFDIICSGHMHDGLLPPFINELINGSRGIISPLREWFPLNAHGTISNENQYLIICGGVTKVRFSKILNFIYPRNIDKILITNDLEKKDYKVKSIYKIK